MELVQQLAPRPLPPRQLSCRCCSCCRCGAGCKRVHGDAVLWEWCTPGGVAGVRMCGVMEVLLAAIWDQGNTRRLFQGLKLQVIRVGLGCFDPVIHHTPSITSAGACHFTIGAQLLRLLKGPPLLHFVCSTPADIWV
eukprot:scaffold100589_cov19-Tisochrysis_lutea.AAC.1